MKNVLSKLAAIAAAVIMIGCGSISNPLSISPKGEMAMSFSIESPDVASGTVTITKDAETVTKPVSFIGSEATVKFNDIDIGRWTVSIELRDAASAVLYSGSAEADVTESAVTTVTIDVPTGKGSLRIAINAPRVPIFWNTLDNESALTESMYGNPMSPYTVSFVPGMFDGAARLYKSQGSHLRCTLWNDGAKVYGRDEVTIEMWFQFVDSQLEFPMLFSAKPISGQYLHSYYHRSASQLYTVAGGSGLTVAVPLLNNSWHHLAMVIQKGAVSIYIDGDRIGIFDISYSIPMPHEFMFGGWVMDDASLSATKSVHGMNGMIDNIKVWNYAKTDFSDRFKE